MTLTRATVPLESILLRLGFIGQSCIDLEDMEENQQDGVIVIILYFSDNFKQGVPGALCGVVVTVMSCSGTIIL